MGKKGGSSWLTAVKRAFRSPTKDSNREDDEDNKVNSIIPFIHFCFRRGNIIFFFFSFLGVLQKREKRRWIFRKPANQDLPAPVSASTKDKPDLVDQAPPTTAVTDQKNALAAARARAEAAMATAQAAAEVARMTRPSNRARDHYAATVIQTAFRGYLVSNKAIYILDLENFWVLSLLAHHVFDKMFEKKKLEIVLFFVFSKARRALRALKGLVKLQALVRGHNVRKQAKMTLKCMQALVRVQARVLDQRLRFSSHESSSSRKSTFSDTNSVWESRYLQDISDRKSMVSLFLSVF